MWCQYSFVDCNGNDQGYKTIQGSFVNKYINSYSTLGSMNVQVGMQVGNGFALTYCGPSYVVIRKFNSKYIASRLRLARRCLF